MIFVVYTSYKGRLALLTSATPCEGSVSAVGAARPTHMAWNWPDVHAALMKSPAFAVFLCGHDHTGGYKEDQGRHFVTVEAMLEGAARSA